MADDITQWIAEVRTLQRQLADTRKERDQAYTSAANWRRLYETEASQRRQDAEQARTQLQALQVQLNLQSEAFHPGDLASNSPESAESGIPADLNARCQELSQRLLAEQQAHAQTRQTLTAALADTMDTLKPGVGC
ncbi:MAG: hypothetical protein ACFCVD_08440 [Nodosilinea sp.]